MARKYDHLRQKAMALRREKALTLDEIVECLRLPRTTVYYWIKDIPIPQTEKQSAAQRRKAQQVREKYAALRDAAYQQGWNEAPALLEDLSFRDFVVLYMAEGSKRDRNTVEFVNSNPPMLVLAHRWIAELTTKSRMYYRLQYHVDQDLDELKRFWADLLNIAPESITVLRKSNSGQLSGRRFRSKYGLLSVRVGDTYLRARTPGLDGFRAGPVARVIFGVWRSPASAHALGA